jgi:hypothetical protein
MSLLFIPTYPNHSLAVNGLVKHPGSEAAYSRMVGNHADFWSMRVLARTRFNRKLAALSFMIISFGCRMVFSFLRTCLFFLVVAHQSFILYMCILWHACHMVSSSWTLVPECPTYRAWSCKALSTIFLFPGCRPHFVGYKMLQGGAPVP